MSRTEKQFAPVLHKMQAHGLHPVVIANFRHYYERLVQGQTGVLPEADIQPVDGLEKMAAVASDDVAETGRAHMDRTVMIKLNGGLGTSMGMQKAKSLLRVKDGLTFLDIIVRQARHAAMPVVFMNSFSTRDDTREALAAYPHLERQAAPVDFLQHRIPKLAADGLGPATWPPNPALEWCPPGHGDIYPALLTSGMLEALLEAGYVYAFVSNADNLGAVFDPALLGYFVQENLAFMMEVARRSKEDRKGGHLARLPSGRLVLREIAQTPEADLDAFQDIRRHRWFNTNSVWIRLPDLKALMDRHGGVLGLPMIRNRKTLDPRDPDSPPVYQLETAMGAAVSVFDKAGVIRVPRSRFAPVKTTNDLLAVRSDSYVLNDRWQLVPNPKRTLKPVRIKLDPAHYAFIDHFEKRFPHGVPSLLNCSSLTVDGDVRFGRGVTLSGGVALVNESRGPVEMPAMRSIEGTIRL
ncbi:MAG TPA: UTP--glucose-1-phosphate uridylyltransferase [Desulfosarcina sp.]|nr:UTP--glucose-1-phosphate uridylyltransferase [Desulfosarcina sp.]